MKTKDAVWKYLDVSTVHVTPNDCYCLDNEILPLIVYKYDEGYWILVPIDDFEVTINEIYKLGGSLFLTDVLEAAANLGCYWVKLDRDGNIFDDLTEYNW